MLGTSVRVNQTTNPRAYADYLRAMQLYRSGTRDSLVQASALLERVVAVDDKYGPGWRLLAQTYSRRAWVGFLPLHEGYAKARAATQRAIDIDPNWTWGYIKLARALALQGLCEEALAQAEIGETRIAGGVAPLCWSWLGAVYALCGDTTRARGKLEQLHALARKQYVDPAAFATVHGALGEVDEALGWYEKAFTDRTPNMVYAAIIPGMSPELVGNARFQAIVDRMHLPKPAR